LKFRKYPPVLEGYSNANWITNFDEFNQLADMFLILEAQQHLRNLSNKYVLLVPLWNQNLYLWIRLEKKQNGFDNF